MNPELFDKLKKLAEPSNDPRVMEEWTVPIKPSELKQLIDSYEELNGYWITIIKSLIQEK